MHAMHMYIIVLYFFSAAKSSPRGSACLFISMYVDEIYSCIREHSH